MDAVETLAPTGSFGGQNPPLFGAMGEDACPMEVWPAAFLIKDIGQSNDHPGGQNTITVTLRTNVPIVPSIAYPDRPAVETAITISRIKGALTMTGNGTAAAVELVPVGGAKFSDSYGNESWASWSASPVADDESSLTLHVLASIDPDNDIVFSFDVYNPALPQIPANPVSISASGIPISVSAMRHAVGAASPMVVKRPVPIELLVTQTVAFPCAENTITVSFKLNVDLHTVALRIRPTFTVTGLTNVTLSSGEVVLDSSNSNDNVQGTGYWEDDGVMSMLTATPNSALVSEGDAIIFSFSFDNPKEAVQPLDAPVLEIAEIGLLPTPVNYPPALDPALRPVTVMQPGFETLDIVQSNPYPAALNTITVTIESVVPLPSDCDVAITISGFQGACVEAADKVVALVDSDDNNINQFVASPTRPSAAMWDDAAKAIKFYMAGPGMQANTPYSFSFTVRNPTTGQASPAISIESAGIVIPAQEMDKNPNSDTPAAFDSAPYEAEPMEVRGSRTAPAFTEKRIEQGSAVAGQVNTITVIMQTNVPLTKSSPVSTVTIKGLVGAVMSPAALQSLASQQFAPAWRPDEEALVLTVTGADTVPGTDYTITFDVENPRKAQSGPAILIESSGIVIQPSTMVSATHDAAPMYVEGPELKDLFVKQEPASAWPAHPNKITVSFTPTVDLEPQVGKRLSIVIGGLEGVEGVADGAVSISGTDRAAFSSCDAFSAAKCPQHKGVWLAGPKMLDLRWCQPSKKTLQCRSNSGLSMHWWGRILPKSPLR
jgi:hypothetical protein